jgi:hypothetical protein
MLADTNKPISNRSKNHKIDFESLDLYNLIKGHFIILVVEWCITKPSFA